MNQSRSFVEQNVAAIDCNFTFIESEPDNFVQNRATQTRIVLPNESSQAFNCEQYLDDGLEFSDNETSKAEGIGNRFNSQESFELQEVSCVSSKRFITPKALNNVYNRLTSVINSASFVQKIQITECR